MEKITYRFTLDTHKNGIQKTLQGFETGDNLTRELECSLCADGNPFELPSDIVALIYIKRPSGTVHYDYCTVDGDKLTYTIPATDIIEDGTNECQFKVIQTDAFGAESVLISPRFNLEIWESLVQDSEAQTDDNFTLLETAIAKAEAYSNKAIVKIYVDDDLMFVVNYADGTSWSSDCIKQAIEGIEKYHEVINGYLYDGEFYYDTAHESICPHDGKLYVDISTNRVYRYNGTQYVSIGGSGGGAVSSVNNKIGDVILTYSDVQALSEDTSIPSFTYIESSNTLVFND